MAKRAVRWADQWEASRNGAAEAADKPPFQPVLRVDEVVSIHQKHVFVCRAAASPAGEGGAALPPPQVSCGICSTQVAADDIPVKCPKCMAPLQRFALS